jgi:hypothetical protein
VIPESATYCSTLRRDATHVSKTALHCQELIAFDGSCAIKSGLFHVPTTTPQDRSIPVLESESRGVLVPGVTIEQREPCVVSIGESARESLGGPQV